MYTSKHFSVYVNVCAVCLHNRDHLTVHILFCNLLFPVNNISGTPFLNPYRSAIYLNLTNFLLFILLWGRKHIYMVQESKLYNRHVFSHSHSCPFSIPLVSSYPLVWSDHSRWLFSCPLKIPCSTSPCFTYTLLT